MASNSSVVLHGKLKICGKCGRGLFKIASQYFSGEAGENIIKYQSEHQVCGQIFEPGSI
jgi:hypothetical protein